MEKRGIVKIACQRHTCETFFGLASIPVCILASLGVTGAAGELGTDDALLGNVFLTVPDAVRFDPAAMDGLPGNGLYWGFVPDGGTMGVFIADIIIEGGGESRQKYGDEGRSSISGESRIEYAAVEVCESVLE